MIEYTGLLIQTDISIYFYDVCNPEAFTSLIDDDFSVKLEMLRGISNRFYYALRDDGAASDSLHVIKFKVCDESKTLKCFSEAIPAPYTGEILALEMDPLNSNDVESYYHDNENLEEW